MIIKLKISLITILLCVIFCQAFDYSENKDITTFNDTELLDSIEKTNTSWLVEYYLSSCSYCVAFAPVYRNFARRLRSWTPVVKMGAVTSADRMWFINNNVTGFPHLRFFVPWSMSETIELHGRTVKELTTELLEAIQETIKQGRGLETWPHLQYILDPEELKSKVNESLVNVIIVENEEVQKNHDGELCIMDNSAILKNVSIYRTFIDTGRMHNMDRPGMYLIRSSQFVYLPSANNRSAYNDLIERLVLAKHNTTFNLDGIVPAYGSEKANLSVTDETYIYREAHGLKMADLLKGLRYTLYSEVPGAKELGGEAMVALRKFIKLLADNLPLEKHVIRFLRNILNELEEVTELTPIQWLNLLEGIESDLAYIPKDLEWQGCRGSEEHLRGYPCSMWMTFHTLTVAAYNRKTNESDDKAGLKTLLTIRNYMSAFFSCEVCRDHFIESTQYWVEQLNDTTSVWDEKRAVIELWKFHNKVNARLHQDPHTEDPIHPKIQFPALEDCISCRRKPHDIISVFTSHQPDWNYDEVFKFLLEYYSIPLAKSCSERGMKIMVTPWTACSKTCGVGISVRMNNNNSACALKLETRMCMDQPCNFNVPTMQCDSLNGLYQIGQPLTLDILNCSSQPLNNLKFCGKCTGGLEGLVCCRPSVTITEKVDMQCKGVEESKVDEDGGVWLNRAGNKTMDIETTMKLRKIVKCHCSKDYCK